MVKRKLIELVLKISSETENMAKSLIMEGRVRVDGHVIYKPGTMIDEHSNISIQDSKKYVSKGGIKLEGAINDFKLSLKSKNAMDVGASTGGFSDCLLRNGIHKLIAVDVGYGIMDWKIRNMENVYLFERTNIRNLEKHMLPFLPEIITVDLSFISIKKVFKKLLDLSEINAKLIILVKPQFEIDKELVEKGGIIKDPVLHIKVLTDLINYLKNFNIKIEQITYSKIKGAKGNIEYFLYLIKSDNNEKNNLYYDKIVRNVVEQSHLFFNNEKKRSL
jgi:23S rRNA (cytidine1920-2'-O)/16S rRNA (cytidine1409-2'-O)-methyltransferase